MSEHVPISGLGYIRGDKDMIGQILDATSEAVVHCYEQVFTELLRRDAVWLIFLWRLANS